MCSKEAREQGAVVSSQWLMVEVASCVAEAELVGLTVEVAGQKLA